jgi:hypothetical protein
MHEVQERLSSLSDSLSSWGSTTFGHVRKEIKRLKRDLEILRAAPFRVSPSYEELKVVDRLVELHHREELMWRQHSRVQWLSEDDRNTHFFHQRASRRKKKNKIVRLTRLDGTVSELSAEMQQMTRSFYDDLYRSEGTQGMEDVLAVVPVSVTAEMNAKLVAPFEEKEVKTALFQMFPTKAPSPDGFPTHFFQRNWELYGEEVTNYVLRVLRGEESPEGINKTCIVLIPKVAQPEDLGKFLPISLCNVIYKISFKVLDNRLKIILPDIISEEKSAFVPSKFITENIITA